MNVLPSNATSTYRREIDGLRALAVLPVVLFHAQVPGFGGGFVGVDLFYVISGYLITGIIAADLAAGSFSFARFYERRARRIIPALLPVLAATALAAWLIMAPDDLHQFSQALATTALFVSNFLFARKESYFYSEEGLQPLLHGWSLSVEEQFYLVFPILLLLVWRWRPRAGLPLAITLFAASFALAALTAGRHPQLAFYMLPTRMWELMAGAICALLPPPERQRHWPGLAGLAMIALGMALVDETTPAPGPLFALPVGGAALILRHGTAGTIAARLLSWRPLVLVGLVSYGTYLWHQPILALARYQWFGPLPAGFRAVAVTASLVLGYASYRLIERPVRERRLLASRRSLALACGLGLVSATACGIAGYLGAIPPVSQPEARQLAETGVLPPEEIVPGQGPLPFVLFGDSHAGQYYRAMTERFGPGALLSMNACLAPPGLVDFAPGDPDRAACAAMPRRLAELVRQRGVRRVIWAQRWDKELWPARGGDSLGETSGPAAPALAAALDRMRAALPADVHLIVVGNAPTAWAYGEEMEGGYLRCRAYLNLHCPASYPAEKAEGRKVNPLLRAFAARSAGVTYIDAATPLCPQGQCRILSGKVLYYRDGSHLTLPAARLVVAQIPPP